MMPLLFILALPLNPVRQNAEPALRITPSEWMTFKEPEAVWQRVSRNEYSVAGNRVVPPDDFSKPSPPLYFNNSERHAADREKRQLFEQKCRALFDSEQIFSETWAGRGFLASPPPLLIRYSEGWLDWNSLVW